MLVGSSYPKLNSIFDLQLAPSLVQNSLSFGSPDRKIQNSMGRGTSEGERETELGEEQRPYHPCMSKELPLPAFLPSSAGIEVREVSIGLGRWLFLSLDLDGSFVLIHNLSPGSDTD